jgi:hypothetical protein
MLHEAHVVNEQWNVAKMKDPYNVKFLALIHIICQRERVCYFNNKNAIMLMQAY